MRMVAISDTHLMHRNQKIEIPDGDILIHAGDSTMTGSAKELKVFNEWFSALPHSHKILIAGNHDWLFQNNPRAAFQILDPSIIYLEDAEAKVFGSRIYGSPWQPWFNDWAFNLRRGAEIKAKWDLIPPNVDVLVTHGPPLHKGDCVNNRPPNLGCADLSRAVKRVNPKYHIFGHIHGGYGKYTGDADSRTIYINASICNESYCPINSPIVVDL